MRAALWILAWVPALAGAEVIHFTLPRMAGVPRAVRAEVGRAVRAAVEAAGHRLGLRRRAKFLLSTQVRKRGPHYFVSVRFREKASRRIQIASGKAHRDGLGALVASLVHEFLPLPRRPAPQAQLPRVETRPPPVLVTPWVGTRPPWPDIYRPDPKQIRPFPVPVDPPPEIGEFRR
jgi:hypothetical protein